MRGLATKIEFVELRSTFPNSKNSKKNNQNSENHRCLQNQGKIQQIQKNQNLNLDGWLAG